MIGESYSPKAQARALGFLSTAWGFGAVMGESRTAGFAKLHCIGSVELVSAPFQATAQAA